MKHILKLFEGWGISLRLNSFQRATWMLTLRYSILIFILLLIVSILTYAVFMLGLGISIGDGPLLGAFDEDTLSHETSERLFNIFVVVDLIVWFVASALSYFLAYITLKPVENIHKEHEKFVGDVAHELRTPLTVLKSGSQTMLQTQRSTKEYSTFISDSLEEVERLIVLSNDLLLLLQQKTIGTVTLESVDLTKIIKTSAQKIKIYAQQNTVTITESIADNVFIRGIAPDLTRLITNMLKNAIDYNRTGGSVTITLEQEGTRALITVSDTGIGVSKDHVLHIFERFYKADSSRVQQDHSGSGLGLAIVKEIVDTHDGTIDVISEVNVGTTFTISLPCV